MTETQKRIKAYQKALPHMKERVIAVATMLVMAVSMMTATTFAWMTLSRSPEISSIATTVTTNGNLEIALSDKDGLQPDDTAVGDGGRDVTLTNLTWGNLINLSSESYGLDYLTLRPASLNSANLISSPLYAVEYGEDGRVLGYFTDFSFSNYNATLGTFGVPSTGIEYGVRAVSSVTYEDAAGETFFASQMKEINKNAANAKNIFNEIIGNSTYMNAISALVGIHVSVSLDDTDISCVQYIDALVSMITDFQASVDAIGQTMVDIANLHLYINEYRETPELFADHKYDLADLKENNYSNSFVTKYNKVIVGLSDYITLAKKTDSAYSGIMTANATYMATGNVYWQADLQAPANQLCNMSTATLDGKTVAQLSSNISSAVSMLFDGNVHQARINDGALKDLDQMLGTPTMVVEDITISVNVPKSYNGTTIPLFGGTTRSITVDVTTAASASTTFVLPEDVKDAEEAITTAAGSSYKGQAIAADTYAMAIDFWIRTNEKNTLLILEGEYQYQEETVPVYGVDASGLDTPLYTYTKTVDGVETSYDVYTDGTTYYLASDHTALTEEDLSGATITAQTETKKTVVGYEGVNRVWDDLDDPNSNAAQQIPVGGTSTTQGSGSCYIFYPESPEDQERCLELLASMRVAFVDAEGTLLGEAGMDTANAIEDAGRILVPLQMRPQAPIVSGTDVQGNEITSTDYITRLTQNEATRVTAIIYLDGANLTNSDVLSAGSINGQLNIQFGTSQMVMEPMENQEIMSQYYTLTWNNSTKLYFDHYDASTCKINLKLLVEGTQPTTIKGNFISYISATQGAREDVFELTLGEDGFWSAEVPFSGPGDYKLRSLQIDGVDIALDEDQCIEVEIDGVKITSLGCYGWDGNSKSLMTAQNVYQQRIDMTISTNQGEVPAIQGVFLGDNGKTVTATFTKVGNGYTGTANFTASGTYKLTYVIVDGVYTPVDESMYQTLNIRLGLRANVVVSQPVNQAYLDLKESLNDESLSEEQIAEIEAQMEAVLQLLHYGNGIEGDENENGLQLTQVNGNWSMIYDSAEELFMDVSCTIVDDQGNELQNLGNVELFYTAGSETNRLTSGVKWNATTGRYEGTFELMEKFGVYRFEMITINGTANTITSASNAPTITSIAPTPMSIVQMAAYEDLVYDLTGSTKRAMYITLQDASAAILSVTLRNGTEEDSPIVTKTISGYSSETAYGNSKRYTFTIPIDSDGYWELESVNVSNVFYGGVFYAGGDDPDGWLELSINDLVEGGETDTYFLTEVELSASGLPTPKTNEFMASNTYNNMYITVMNQKRPLVDVLSEVAELYTEYNVEDTVSVYMTYTWEKYVDASWTVNDETKLPTRDFGGWLTMNADGQYAMGNMNFLVEGWYYADFQLVIGENTYNTLNDLPSGVTLSGSAYALETNMSVSWEDPEVKITAVTGATKESVNNTKFTVNLAADSDYTNNPLAGVQNYFEDYYANVYIMGEYKNYSVPTVTITLTNAGNTAGTSFVISNSSREVTYNFDKSGDSSEQEIGVVDLGGYRRTEYGTLKGSSIGLTYSDATYTFKVTEVNVKQDVKPIYLQYVVSENSSKAPATVISPDGRAMTVTLADIEDWTSSASETVTLEETVKVAATTVRTDYKVTNRSGYSWSGYTYTYAYYYYQQRTVTRGTGLRTTTTSYSLNGWTIDGVLKNVGDQVTITAAKTATASVGNSSTSTTVPAETYDVVQETHVEGPTGQSSKPSGGQEIASLYNLWSGISIIDGWQDT